MTARDPVPAPRRVTRAGEQLRPGDALLIPAVGRVVVCGPLLSIVVDGQRVRLAVLAWEDLALIVRPGQVFEALEPVDTAAWRRRYRPCGACGGRGTL